MLDLPDHVERHREVRVERATAEQPCATCLEPIRVGEHLARVNGGPAVHATCALRARRNKS
jgi:hypothetical protein